MPRGGADAAAGRMSLRLATALRAALSLRPLFSARHFATTMSAEAYKTHIPGERARHSEEQ